MDPAPADTFEALSDEIVALCGHLHGGECRLIELIRRLESLKPWNGEVPSCAHWLNVRCGLDLVTAREKVRIAHALDDLPLIREAFRAGDLSYSKVRAITRIAEWDTEAELVELAKSTTAEHVAKLVRARRQADQLSAPGAALNAWTHRYLDCHSAADGSVVFEGRLPAEQGALLLQALDRAVEWLRSEEREEPWRAFNGRTPEEAVPEKQQAHARRADALAVLAERFLARMPEADESLNTADRFLITVHAPAEALPEYATIDHEDPPQFEDGSVAAPETVRRLCCDASVVRILETGEGEPLDVGRKTRVIPPSMRRALKRRDSGCRFPGCTNTKFFDGHHILHWADGGETRLDNLVTVCRFHHRLIHEGGYYVVKDGSEFRFFRAHGHEVRAIPATLIDGFERAERDLFTCRSVESQGLGYAPWELPEHRGPPLPHVRPP